MKCPDNIVLYMHEYLDEEIDEHDEQLLKKHLQTCPKCQNYFHELEKAIALVQSTSHIQAPSNFTENVMARLPKERKRVGVNRWFRHHPLLTAASLFIILMTGSLLSTWNKDHEFSVTKQPDLVVHNNTVIVPEGKVIKGDITVRNGDLQVEGKVEGDVTVINGENYMASAGNVTGEIKVVNEVFDWIWYHIKKTSKELISVFN
ncbi:anti-sigma factor family protein [Robertmurraya korlensis]|uniref:anti-sigma factor family protein n=1 Tax=Robertmurraya korlensis TaxID=519977 RepID=UPI0008240F45|nr:anti-sigma factor [Robertmurraya korlensis]